MQLDAGGSEEQRSRLQQLREIWMPAPMAGEPTRSALLGADQTLAQQTLEAADGVSDADYSCATDVSERESDSEDDSSVEADELSAANHLDVPIDGCTAIAQSYESEPNTGAPLLTQSRVRIADIAYSLSFSCSSLCIFICLTPQQKKRRSSSARRVPLSMRFRRWRFNGPHKSRI